VDQFVLPPPVDSSATDYPQVVVEPAAMVSELYGFVLGAAPGMKPKRGNDEVADEMIDTAEFLESMGYDPWQLRLMATRWRWGEPSREQYDLDIGWLHRQVTIAIRHTQGDRTDPLTAEPIEHVDRTRAEIENPRNKKANLAHAAHASRRPPDYQLKVLEQRWEAAVRNGRDLLGDATLLADAKRLPRAFALAYFALEELAKVPLLITAALRIANGEAVDYRELEADLTSHNIKWEMAAIATTLVDFGLKELEIVFTDAQQEELTARLSARPLRELALYTDYKRGQVSEPKSIVDQALADAALGTARRLLADFSSLVGGLNGIASNYASPAFHDQIVAAATAWQGLRTEP
jgi:AbiV family abortive infection protein